MAFASLLGELMIPGMVVSAFFDASMAATYDYTERCDRVGKYTEAINTFKTFVDGMENKWATVDQEIENIRHQISMNTYQIIKVNKDANEHNKKILRRTRINTAVITSLISLLLLLKLYLKDI
tara:strand:- start:1018 stop:1386 length:369 start_codon:yes stop_codon:yes gene_type:complete